MPAPRSCLVVVVLMAAAAWLPTACGSSCDRNPDEVPHVYTGGVTTAGIYESAPADGPFLYFPPGRTYRFVHGLGAMPTQLHSYLAYDEFPASFTEGAGNQVTFENPTDTHVDVRNDTCSSVRLRVVLEGTPGGAVTDGGPGGDGAAGP